MNYYTRPDKMSGVGRKGTTLFADNLNHFLSSSETIMNKEFQRFLFAEKWVFSAA